MLIISYSIVCITLLSEILFDYFGLSIYYKSAAIFAFMIGFSLGAGPITWLYMADALPDIGVSISSSANWLFVAIIGIGFPLANDNFGTEVTFTIFLICALLGLIFMIFALVETKGKN